MDIYQIINKARNTGFSLSTLAECETGGILGLQNDQLSSLVEQGALIGDFWKDEDFNDDPFRDGLSLVIGVDAQEDLWEDERPETIDPLLMNSYFSYVSNSPQPKLVLASSLSLYELLPKYYECFPVESFTPLEDISAEKCKPRISPINVSWLRKERELSTRVDVCDFSIDGSYCGIPLCFSEFAWIKNGMALFYMYTSGDFITRAWIYPFITDYFIQAIQDESVLP